jgi:alpha-beta hydrolase superfamily lysophospholipase
MAPINTNYRSSYCDPRYIIHLIPPGLGDHIERYDELFLSLAAAGIKTIGMDLRGFGQTFKYQNEDLNE